MPGCLYEAVISKSAGGIGVAISNVRATGSYVRGTNGKSNGLIPMLRWVFLAGWGIFLAEIATGWRMDGICRSILLSGHFCCCAEKHHFGKTCRYLDSAGAQFMESSFIIPPFWHCLASLKDAFWNHIATFPTEHEVEVIQLPKSTNLTQTKVISNDEFFGVVWWG